MELPTQVEENSEHAQFQDGVLIINFKKALQSQVRKISINESTPRTENSNK